MQDFDSNNSIFWTTEGEPPLGRTLLLQTVGNVCVIGEWRKNNHYIAWCDIPEKTRFRPTSKCLNTASKVLLINPGGVIVLGPIDKSSSKFLGWHETPKFPSLLKT